MLRDYDPARKYEILERVGFRKFFKEGNWADYNRQFFDGLAPKYDFIDEVLSFGMHTRFKGEAWTSSTT